MKLLNATTTAAMVGLFALAAPVLAQDMPALSELEAAGKVVFEEDIGCIACHGDKAKGDIGIGPDIRGKKADDVRLQIESNEMMMFDITDEQLEAVIAYLAYLKANT